MVTWTSVFPLDALKTRVQTWDLVHHRQGEGRPLLSEMQSAHVSKDTLTRSSTLHIAREAYKTEGIQVFFRGLGVCNARAFVVNAVQFFVRVSAPSTLPMYSPTDKNDKVYEWIMRVLAS